MNKKTFSAADEFSDALDAHAPEFGVELSEETTARLRAFYELVSSWNARLHLVAPCAPEEFAVRHVLESLLAVKFIPPGGRLIDVGSGAGLPIVPCLVARPDTCATLVESSTKKAVFLREALRRLGLQDRARVVAERFEKIAAPEAEFVTCRAVERFGEILATLVEWSPQGCALILYGGHSLREKLDAAGLVYTTARIPRSERRFIFVVERES